jgi:hypothetical protein
MRLKLILETIIDHKMIDWFVFIVFVARKQFRIYYPTRKDVLCCIFIGQKLKYKILSVFGIVLSFDS